MEGARYTLLCGAGTRIKRDTRLPMEAEKTGVYGWGGENGDDINCGRRPAHRLLDTIPASLVISRA